MQSQREFILFFVVAETAVTDHLREDRQKILLAMAMLKSISLSSCFSRSLWVSHIHIFPRSTFPNSSSTNEKNKMIEMTEWLLLRHVTVKNIHDCRKYIPRSLIIRLRNGQCGMVFREIQTASAIRSTIGWIMWVIESMKNLLRALLAAHRIIIQLILPCLSVSLILSAFSFQSNFKEVISKGLCYSAHACTQHVTQ